MTAIDPDAPGSTTVSLTGEIDVRNATEIGDRLCDLIDDGHDTIIVECSAVTFVESRGLAMMARVQRSADDAGCRLSWRTLPLPVLRNIHVSGLDTYLHIEA